MLHQSGKKEEARGRGVMAGKEGMDDGRVPWLGIELCA
jgi:hypothetical protein